MKEIESVLDDEPVIFNVNLELWNWISRYYICPLGDVMKAALPSGLKHESTSVVTLFSPVPEEGLSDQERPLVQCVTDKKLTINETEKRLGPTFLQRGFCNG